MAFARPTVLWSCAVILGVAAGFNYVRLHIEKGAVYASQAQSKGFETGSDYVDIASMLGDNHIQTLDAHQFDLLQKYANGKGTAPQYVAGIMDNIQDDGLAQRLVPLVQTLRRKIPNHPIITSLADAWDRQGCHVAASRIRDNG